MKRLVPQFYCLFPKSQNIQIDVALMHMSLFALLQIIQNLAFRSKFDPFISIQRLKGELCVNRVKEEDGFFVIFVKGRRQTWNPKTIGSTVVVHLAEL